jgi:hypothetical protein
MIIQIFADKHDDGKCRSCGRAIVWCETKAGKNIPFDAPLVAAQSYGDVFDGRALESVDTEVSPTHFSSCPDGKVWSGRGAKGRRRAQ